MTEQSSAVTPVPGHLHTLTPRSVVRRGAGAIEFYRAAFAAEEVGERLTGPSGAVNHAGVRIGGVGGHDHRRHRRRRRRRGTLVVERGANWESESA